MDIESKLTVFFAEPFWIGLYERRQETRLEVAKIIFGAEPKDYDVFAYLQDNWYRIRFTKPIVTERKAEQPKNPKRLQRAVKRELVKNACGTKSQEALKLEQENKVLERKIYHRRKTEAEKQLRFDLKQLKKKEKHKGR